jgi:hypothetical protein
MGPHELRSWQRRWAERPLAQDDCAAMTEKYLALAALEALPRGPEQDAALRRAAARWPGCLRESQLVGPDRCRQRCAQAEAGAASEARSRAQWLAEGAGALPLWADLHRLLRDQLAWRAAGGSGEAADFVRRLDAEGRERWPGPGLLTAVGGPQVRARQAYQWLAGQAGLSLAALNFVLFARQGHWDARPGDPPVSA